MAYASAALVLYFAYSEVRGALGGEPGIVTQFNAGQAGQSFQFSLGLESQVRRSAKKAYLAYLRTVLTQEEYLRASKWYQAFERTHGYAASLLVGGIGFFQVLWDKGGLTMHDKLAGTTVVRRPKQPRRKLCPAPAAPPPKAPAASVKADPENPAVPPGNVPPPAAGPFSPTS